MPEISMRHITNAGKLRISQLHACFTPFEQVTMRTQYNRHAGPTPMGAMSAIPPKADKLRKAVGASGKAVGGDLAK